MKASPVVGILERSDIGLLIIDREKPASRDPTKHVSEFKLKLPNVKLMDMFLYMMYNMCAFYTSIGHIQR